MIEGRPTAEELASPTLRALIVPFAGVPDATLELLKQFPNVAAYNLHHNATSTAELAVSLLLTAAKLIVPQDKALRHGDWSARYAPSRSVTLEGKTALILGYGEIGKRVALALKSLGMEVLALRRSGPGADSVAKLFGPESLHDLLPRTQVLIVALPQTSATLGLIGSQELGLMPPGGILVNIARAQIVDEEALFLALQSGHLHSAGLDVWYRYPQATGNEVPTYFTVPESARSTPPSRFPFGDLENVVMTPHRAGASQDTEERRVRDLAALLEDLAVGREPANKVHVEAGY